MPDDALDTATHCVLGFVERSQPQMVPLAFWFDGSQLWLSLQSDSREVAALRREASCSVYVPAVDGAAATVIRGSARVFGFHDPLGLAVHGPVISTAMAALAAHNAGAIAGYVQDASRVPARLLPRNRVAVRISVVERRDSEPVVPPAGIAPALPAVVPTNVRRAVAGQRQVVLATVQAGSLEIGPAAWGAGFVLTVPPQRVLSPGVAAAALVQTETQRRPTATAGLILSGFMGSNGALRPERATSWSGFETLTADIPAVRSSVVLPD